jgi:hypothetical protein
VFLSAAERDLIMGDLSKQHDYYCVKSRLLKKLRQFATQELPLLIEKGYIDFAEYRKIAENCKIDRNMKPTCPFGHGLAEEQKDIIISSNPESARGSPRPARAGSNLVGRGIANPMSERTRGFELPSKDGTKVPLPALPHTILLSLLSSLPP